MHIELVIAKLITMILGFLIAYQAFRGYRSHDSKPMLYVGIGFLFISIGSVIEGILFEIVGLEIFLAGTIQTLIVAVGMLVILYSLHGNIDETISDGVN